MVVTAAVGHIEFASGDSQTLRLTAYLDLAIDLVGLKIDSVDLAFGLLSAVDRSGIGTYVGV